MSDTTVAGKKKRSRLLEYGIVLVVIGIVVAAAAFSEPLLAFMRLRLWDRGAPGRAVEQFLIAGRKGDQQAADAMLGSKDFQPLTKDGKWIGYFIVTPAGKMEFDFNELAPAEPKAGEVEFNTIGPGAATVAVPDSAGKPVKYRLIMQDGAWKINEILGGRGQGPTAAPPGAAKSGAAPKPPGGRG
jgi:hypothetical protein